MVRKQEKEIRRIITLEELNGVIKRGDPKPRLDNVERAKLSRLVHEKETWTLRDARIMIKEQFKIEYSEMQVWRILRSMNMHHAKPYILDKRRPEDAEDILKKTCI